MCCTNGNTADDLRDSQHAKPPVFSRFGSSFTSFEQMKFESSNLVHRQAIASTEMTNHPKWSWSGSRDHFKI